MIKRIFSVLVLCSLLCGYVVFSEEVETRQLESGEIFLNDTFEYQLDDTTPSGYTVDRNGNIFTLKTESASRRIMCSYSLGQQETKMRFDKNFGVYLKGQLVMECKVKATSEQASVSIFSAKSSVNSWKPRIVTFTDDGKINFCGEEIGEYEKNTDYHIILFFDTELNTLKCRINSVDTATETFSLDDIKAVRFEADFTSDYAVYFDDIRIYGGSEVVSSFPVPEYNKDYALVSGEEYAGVFERPDAAKILNNFSDCRPRVLVDENQINTLKALYTEDDTLKGYVDDIIAIADGEISKSPVGYSDTTPRTVAQRIKNRVAILGMAYLYTNDDKYAQRLWQEAESFCGFSDWFLGDQLSHAEFLYSSAFVYDWLYQWFEKEGNRGKREILYNALMEKGLKRCEQVYDVAAYGFKSTWATLTDNILSVCNSGVICACLALLEKENNDERVLKCLEFSVKAPEGFLKNFAPDGGWHEGFTYASYGIRYFVQALSSLKNSCGTDFGLSKAPGFSEATDFYIYLTAPGGIFNFHDSEWYYRRAASEMYYFANEFEKPYLGFYAEKFHRESGSSVSFLDLAFYKGGYEDCALPLDKYFRGVETAMFRSPESYLGVHAGRVGVTHGEFDAGSFVFDALGERFIEDLGPDSYSLTGYNTVRDDFIYYRRRAEGHNTLVVNPSELAGQSTNGETKITKFLSFPKSGFAMIDLTSAYTAFNVTSAIRSFLYNRDKQSVIIQDEISCTQPSEIYSFFHSKADIEISDNKKEALLTRNGKSIKAVLLSPTDAKLSVMDAIPLTQIEGTENQSSNTGVRKLYVNLSEVESEKIVYMFLPAEEVSETSAVCTFKEENGEILAEAYVGTQCDDTPVTFIFAGYNENNALSAVNVKKTNIQPGINLFDEVKISSTDVKNYKLFTAYDNKLDFEVFSKEVD